MKTVVLIPLKNEDWILEKTLQNITPFVDTVIIGDQQSNDRSIEICRQFSNVKIINNPYEGHSNKIRWLLLDEARKLGEHNLIICIDADEMISPEAIKEMQVAISLGKAIPGDTFRFRWIQLWKNIKSYRNDGVWRNSFKNIAFIDNEGSNEYVKKFVINDHTSRIPESNIRKEIDISYPLLHFHFLPWKRNQLKQAWYRCSELIEGSRNAKMINSRYMATLDSENIECLPLPKEWSRGLTLPENLENISSPYHLDAILGFFSKYGIKSFEELQIWHIPELHEEFMKKVGREPVSKTYPRWVIILNDVKNRLKRFRF